MAGRKKEVEPDEPAGAPEWMVTFSDCMTLLLTFFVLLLTFSSFDVNVFRQWRSIFSKALSTVSTAVKKDKDGFLPATQFRYDYEVEKGSEKRTLARGKDNNLKKEGREDADFLNQKVFYISSSRIFWGNGTIISLQGRKILSTLASFLREAPSRVVISENGLTDEKSNEQLGLPRAWAAMKYLTEKHGLDKKQFSISAMSTLTQENLKNIELSSPETKTERTLEIVLLERSIYN
ncbi:MAG: flagellar motor protein MotB [Planctomycetota bacterium]|jgi:chemotaxis protein MotB